MLKLRPNILVCFTSLLTFSLPTCSFLEIQTHFIFLFLRYYIGPTHMFMYIIEIRKNIIYQFLFQTNEGLV